MTKQELIDKLKELGVYEKWKVNAENEAIEWGLGRASEINRLLNEGFDFQKLISCSFAWVSTYEGWAFWNEISKK